MQNKMDKATLNIINIHHDQRSDEAQAQNEFHFFSIFNNIN